MSLNCKLVYFVSLIPKMVKLYRGLWHRLHKHLEIKIVPVVLHVYRIMTTSTNNASMLNSHVLENQSCSNKTIM